MFDPILEVTENANTYTPLAPGDERIVSAGWVLWMGRGDEPGWNVAQRLRLDPDEIEAARAEIHLVLRARGRTACTWEVGSSAMPADLVERLVALGLVELEDEFAVGMALTEPMAAPSEEIEVRRAASQADEEVAAEIAAVVFGGGRVARAFDPDSDVVSYLAYLQGRPVGRATGSFSEHGVSLFGGAVLPEGRGCGVYRALVQARVQDAWERGTPAAFTQGGRLSRPILRRLGFRETCEIRMLLDAFDRS